MTNNELLTKETNEIIKSALTGGTFEYLANSVAKQLPTRADGSTPSKEGANKRGNSSRLT